MNNNRKYINNTTTNACNKHTQRKHEHIDTNRRTNSMGHTKVGGSQDHGITTPATQQFKAQHFNHQETTTIISTMITWITVKLDEITNTT